MIQIGALQSEFAVGIWLNALGLLAAGLIVVAGINPVLCQSPLTQKERVALSSERWNEALAAADLAIKANPRDAEAYSTRGKALFKIGKREEAVEAFNRALGLNPKLIDPALFQYRAECYIDQNKLDEAIADLQQAIKYYPNAAENKLLGHIYVRRRQLPLAIEYFSRALQLDNNNFWIIKDRGDAYAGSAQYEHALSDYSKLIKLKPAEALGYNARAQVYEKMGKPDLAESDRKKAGALTAKYY